MSLKDSTQNNSISGPNTEEMALQNGICELAPSSVAGSRNLADVFWTSLCNCRY